MHQMVLSGPRVCLPKDLSTPVLHAEFGPINRELLMQLHSDGKLLAKFSPEDAFCSSSAGNGTVAPGRVFCQRAANQLGVVFVDDAMDERSTDFPDDDVAPVPLGCYTKNWNGVASVHWNNGRAQNAHGDHRHSNACTGAGTACLAPRPIATRATFQAEFSGVGNFTMCMRGASNETIAVAPAAQASAHPRFPALPAQLTEKQLVWAVQADDSCDNVDSFNTSLHQNIPLTPASLEGYAKHVSSLGLSGKRKLCTYDHENTNLAWYVRLICPCRCACLLVRFGCVPASSTPLDFADGCINRLGRMSSTEKHAVAVRAPPAVPFGSLLAPPCQTHHLRGLHDRITECNADTSTVVLPLSLSASLSVPNNELQAITKRNF